MVLNSGGNDRGYLPVDWGYLPVEEAQDKSMYETDEEEFDPGATSNGLSNMQRVTLGQSNRQPGDTLQFPAECPQVQDEQLNP